MAIYKCAVCGAVFDEDKEGKNYRSWTAARFANSRFPNLKRLGMRLHRKRVPPGRACL